MKSIFNRSKKKIKTNSKKKTNTPRKQNQNDKGRYMEEVDSSFDFKDLEYALEDIETDKVVTLEDSPKKISRKNEFESLNQKLNELQNKYTDIVHNFKGTKSELEKILRKFDENDQNIKKLLSIYEVVSTNINPFIETDLNKKNEDMEESKNDLCDLENSNNDLESPDLSYDLNELNKALNESKNDNSEKHELEIIGPHTDKKEQSEQRNNNGNLNIIPTKNHHLNNEQSPLCYYDQRQKLFEVETSPVETSITEGEFENNGKKPILEHIPDDYLSTVIVLRWIEFLLEHVSRDRLTILLNYYKRINWISKDVKKQLMSFARGEISDINRYEPIHNENDELINPYDGDSKVTKEYRQVGEWRLTAEDHLKSLLFIKKLAGKEINKDSLNSLEYEISKLKEGLESFHNL